MTDIGQQVSDHLVAYLEEHEITAAELAKRCGVSESAMSRYINQVRTPSGRAIYRIMNATGWILTPALRVKETEAQCENCG